MTSFRLWRVVLLLLIPGSFILVAPGVRASTSAASSAAPGTPLLPSVPLPKLPTLPSTKLPLPSSAAKQDLDERLVQLLATRVSGPLASPKKLKFLTADLSEDLVPAIGQTIQDLRENLKGSTVRKLLGDARKRGREARKKREKEEEATKATTQGDWLIFMLDLNQRSKRAWRDGVRLYGMLRMLEAIGTTPAVRQMVACYSYFGELVRIDLQRSIARLGEKAAPALIEAKSHDARKVRRWARRQLDNMGRAIPGEAVSTNDPVILADVLLAFGRTRDVDATRILLSFAQSEQPRLRDAARASIGAIGKAALWHLKDAYQSLTGKKAPRAWTWRRAARELFRLHDQSEMAPIYEHLTAGQQALKEKKYGEAVKFFDRVLAHAPLLPQRDQLAPAYVKHGENLMAEKQYEPALIALRKALRLSQQRGADQNKIASRIALVESLQLGTAAGPDLFLLKRALKLDPNNKQAAQFLGDIDAQTPSRKSHLTRYVAAGGIGLAALLLLLLLARSARLQRQRRVEVTTADN